jgi:type III secretion system YscQ/HrcQ family protein
MSGEVAQMVAPRLDGTPGLMRRVSAAEVRRFNSLVGTHRELGFSWAGKPAQLRLVDAARAPRARGWLRLRLDDHSFELGVPDLPEPSSLGASFAGIEVAALPEELLLGVLEIWLADAIAALQPHGVSMHLTAWRTDAPSKVVDCGWELDWGGQERFLAGTLHADREALDFLSGLLHRARLAPAAAADTVPFAVSVSLARIPFSRASARALAPGDVVLLPVSHQGWAHGDCELWTADRLLGRAIKQGPTVKILTMNSSSEAKPVTGVAGELSVDELPVHLAFDVGHLEFNMGQLRTLREGFTFELPVTTDRLVTIRVNGRAIGHGELVEIGDKVGVRIVNWALV